MAKFIHVTTAITANRKLMVNVDHIIFIESNNDGSTSLVLSNTTIFYVKETYDQLYQAVFCAMVA